MKNNPIWILVWALALALFLAYESLAAQKQQEFNPQRLEEFNDVYVKFYKRYHGCQMTAVRPEECVPAYGVLDAKLLEEVRKRRDF